MKHTEIRQPTISDGLKYRNMDLEDALDWLDTEDWINGHLYSRRPNAHLSVSRTFQPISNRYQKFLTHLRSSPLEAIDPRTRMVLFKMLNRGIFDDINGCISTGKEAIVYHATKDSGQEFAVKVYKTSASKFKDGGRSIQADYRFRHGYCKRNPRHMVKTWAENEMRNLMRLKAAGIRCPTPIFLRLHVLVMEFIGQSGRAAPSLKDANLSEDEMSEGYLQMIRVMRTLYQNCKLVHGDLSEYNTLYYEGNLHIINVSQSVDIDHPLALDFLREDCKRVSEFFERNGVDCITIRKLFDFIVDSSITDESVGCYLEEVQREILAGRALRFSVISVKSYIPSMPNQVKYAEFANWLASDTIGFQCLIKHSLSTAQKQPTKSETNYTSTKQTNKLGTEYRTNEDDKAEDKDNYNDSKGAEPYDTTNDGTQETLPDKKAARKENKKKVKEEKREARKTKTPKAVRKKKKKLAKNIKAR